MAGWLDSPGHRANILKAEFTEIGVGVATGDGKYGIYWVQVFATPGGRTTGSARHGSRSSGRQDGDDGSVRDPDAEID